MHGSMHGVLPTSKLTWALCSEFLFEHYFISMIHWLIAQVAELSLRVGPHILWPWGLPWKTKTLLSSGKSQGFRIYFPGATDKRQTALGEDQILARYIVIKIHTIWKGNGPLESHLSGITSVSIACLFYIVPMFNKVHWIIHIVLQLAFFYFKVYTGVYVFACILTSNLKLNTGYN